MCLVFNSQCLTGYATPWPARRRKAPISGNWGVIPMAQCAQNPEAGWVSDARVQSLQRELDRAHDTHAEISDRLEKLERDNVLDGAELRHWGHNEQN